MSRDLDVTVGEISSSSDLLHSTCPPPPRSSPPSPSSPFKSPTITALPWLGELEKARVRGSHGGLKVGPAGGVYAAQRHERERHRHETDQTPVLALSNALQAALQASPLCPSGHPHRHIDTPCLTILESLCIVRMRTHACTRASLPTNTHAPSHISYLEHFWLACVASFDLKSAAKR